MTPHSGSEPWQDVRRVGFATRVDLDHALAQLFDLLPAAATEHAPLGSALGRTTAMVATAPASMPFAPTARIDGYAIAAADSYGASAYNPIRPQRDLIEVTAGAPMPPGTDAVLPYGAVGEFEIVEALAPGDGVMPAGGYTRAAEMVVPAGERIGALAIARAAEAGIENLAVWRCPRVALTVAGPKQGRHALDPLLTMLDCLITRDGGSTEAAGTADLALMAGRSGCGADDDAAPALAATGRMLLHGLAIAPGGSTGIGRSDGVTVVLLPGEPLACLVAYELVAGPAVRRIAGLDTKLPHARKRCRLAAKFASRIGTTEVWLVGPHGEEVMPLASPDTATLAMTAGALGFVVVPAALEGCPAGAQVEVHLFGDRHGE